MFIFLKDKKGYVEKIKNDSIELVRLVCWITHTFLRINLVKITTFKIYIVKQEYGFI